jgi:hypothetical protein
MKWIVQNTIPTLAQAQANADLYIKIIIFLLFTHILKR